MAKGGRKTRADNKKDPLSDERAIFGPKSKLLNVDLTEFFLNPLAWDTLTEAQRQDLRAKFPPHITYDDTGKPSFEFLKYDVYWKSDLRRFKEDLEEGRYEPEWLEEAHQAMTDRAEGKFDAWKLEQYEEFWGQKAEYDDHEFSGALDEVQLEHLIAEGIFEEGDIWFYSRAFGRGKRALLIEMDARIDKIDDFARLKFTVGKVGITSPAKRTYDEAFSTAHDKHPNNESPTKIMKFEETTTAMLPRSEENFPMPPFRHTNSKDHELLKDSRQEDNASVGTTDSAAEAMSTIVLATPTRNGILKENVSTALISHTDLEHATDVKLSAIAPIEDSDLNEQKDGSSLTSKETGLDNQATKTAQEDQASIASTESSRLYSTRRNRAPRDILDPSTPVKPREKPSPRKTQFPLTVRIDSPEELERNILNADGRRKWDSRSDSWKRFRCKRDGKDLGCLWDLREKYWLRKNGKIASKSDADV